MSPINRRDWLSRAAAGALTLLPRAHARGAAPKPNIVFILADDLGYRDVGCYGQRNIRTPNIDQLAKDGMRFTDAYAVCTVCAPSRSVLMTGRHMGHTPIRGNGAGSLLADEVTVAEVLHQAGYATGAFGKWGLGEEPGQPGVPTKKGFDRFFGYLNQAHAHFYYPEYLYQNEEKYPLTGNDHGKRTTYSHDVIAGQALDFIRQLLVPEGSLKEYRGKFAERAFIDKRNHYARQDESHAAYAGMITRMDRDVGRILALLQQLNLDRNTLVFCTSDNGPALPIIGDDYFESKGPLRGHKENFYEGGIRVPMIARWPGQVAAGSVSHLPWGFQDVMPTLSEVAGAAPPNDIDGISILPTLLGEAKAGRKQKAHEYLYWELLRTAPGNRWAYRKETPMQAMRMGSWKAVRPHPEGPLELYNLAVD
ncbi:MAG: arylsulfatase, partial [Acidobacteria bacterium]|nr:arylsulfatase [Acidobacteriota bacterium]